MSRFLPCRRHAGFSLIEMIVVVAILIILLALLTPTLMAAMERARLVQCSANLRTIHQGILAFAEDKEGILPPSSSRPWRLYPEYWEADVMHRWAGSWPTLLVKAGYLPKPPTTEDSSVMPPRGQSVFWCPSGRYEIGVFTPSSMFDERGKGAWMTEYPVTDVPHGPNNPSTEATYHWFPVWYGLNGDTFYGDRYPYLRNPNDGGSDPRRPTLQHIDRVQNPTAMISLYDGIWLVNRVTSRVNARHLRSTHTNLAMMDGSVRHFETATLPPHGSTDPTLYPRWRFGNY